MVLQMGSQKYPRASGGKKMSYIYRITAKPTGRRGMNFDPRDVMIPQVVTLKDLNANPSPKTRSGFCLNCNGKDPRETQYTVERLGTAVLSTKDSSRVYCKRCGHALFWSKHYKEI
jgi:uncharacterized protein with PIN domain